MSLYLKDTDGKPSLTATLLVSGFTVCTLKLLVSGLEIGSIKLGVFGGGDYAAAVGALGALYWARRNVSNANSGSNDANS
jgi:hypothetical protein